LVFPALPEAYHLKRTEWPYESEVKAGGTVVPLCTFRAILGAILYVLALFGTPSRTPTLAAEPHRTPQYVPDTPQYCMEIHHTNGPCRVIVRTGNRNFFQILGVFSNF
jgi:hypothetical protein